MSRAERVERVESCPFCGKGTAVEHDSLDNCFIVRCLHCGYTSGHIASERGAMIRHNKICRALPKPDPDWKATCAKCCDGDIEPDCEYYGEPNGCNSPIYGQHPQSAPVGNMVAMREVVTALAAVILPPRDKAGEGGWLAWVRAMQGKARAALAAPPRNCDVGTAEEQEKRFHDFCRARHLPRMEESRYCAYKCPLEGDTCCELQWAQMPYVEKEGGAK